jgi:hypothetical protein
VSYNGWPSDPQAVSTSPRGGRNGRFGVIVRVPSQRRRGIAVFAAVGLCTSKVRIAGHSKPITRDTNEPPS